MGYLKWVIYLDNKRFLFLLHILLYPPSVYSSLSPAFFLFRNILFVRTQQFFSFKTH